MNRRLLYALSVAVLTVPTLAFYRGGWALVTIDDLPTHAVVGTPIQLNYTVRQHGVTLVDKLDGEINATGPARLNAKAKGTGSGHYTSEMTFNTPGTWQVEVRSGFGPARALVPMRVVARGAPAPVVSLADRGRDVYAAKGCAECHEHAKVPAAGFSSKSGQDLSEPRFAPEYLARFLADPSIKTNWTSANRMPNLGLKAPEIAAMIAFLNPATKAGTR